MKASELRIGNLVWIDIGLPLYNLHYFTAGDFGDLHNKKLKDEQFMPIPLTEERLVRFGFEKEGEEDLYTLSNESLSFDLVFDNNKIRLGDMSDMCYTTWNTPVSQVHQLQNLYFALTGEEIIYNGNNLDKEGV
jgi:hypothetical protein